MQFVRDGRWMRCSKTKPCPICGRGDWCCWLSNGEAFYCMRSSIEVSGWKLGKTTDSGGTTYFPLTGEPPVPTYRVTASQPCESKCKIPWQEISDHAEKLLNPKMLQSLTRSLKLSRESLVSMNVGWNNHYEAFTFPMRNASTQSIVGIRTRTLCGAKFALTGSKQGCFLDPLAKPNKDGYLYICEGPTDTAAILGIGLNAIGRACCSHAPKSLLDACAGRKVVILGDVDKAGVAGACALKKLIGDNAVTVFPPAHKDARLWVTERMLTSDELITISDRAFKERTK